MAAKRIPQLDAISGVSTANDDNLVIYDTSAGMTKRILRSQLAAGMVGDLPYTPSGGIAATTVPTAIAELDSEAAKSAALAATGGAALVGYTQGGSGASARTAQDKLRESVSVKDFGAVGDGVTSDATAETTAHSQAAGRAVLYPFQLGESYAGTQNKFNMYGSSIHTSAVGNLVQAGLPNAPTGIAQPVTWVQKFSSVNRSVVPTNFDQVGYFGLIKQSGDAYSVALTGFARIDGGDGGDTVGVHGRAQVNNVAGSGFAGWFVAETSANIADEVVDLIGIEINFVNRKTTPLPFTPAPGKGTYRGLAVLTADSGRNGHIGIDVGKQSIALGGWYRGLRIRKDGVEGDTVSGGKTCCALLEGRATLADGRVTGVVFGSGYFRAGIDFRDSDQIIGDNRAINLRPDHRIYWNETGDAISRYVHVASGSNTFAAVNLNIDTNGDYRVNNARVVTDRQVGWGAMTGTATRTSFATSTVTLEELAERVKALLDDLAVHGLIGA